MKRAPRPDWPEELTLELLAYIESKKYTAKQIGDMMGFTRSAIIGKAHRLGLSIRGGERTKTEPGKKKKETSAPQTTALKKALPLKDVRLSPATALVLPPKEEEVERPWVPGRILEPYHRVRELPLPENPKRLTELPHTGCKYPVARDHEGEWLMCADRRQNDKPYCAPHCQESYQPRQYKVARR